MTNSAIMLAGFDRIGFIGGTFDPVHIGHLLIAEHVRDELELPCVLFIPSAHPPHKPDRTVTDAEHRYAMVKLVTAQHPKFEASRIEIERAGPSYTITTIRQLCEQSGADIYFITGCDSVLDMPNWYKPDAILEEAHVVTMPRPGFEIEQIREKLGRQRADRVQILDGPAVDISATDIRDRVSEGRSIRYMTPDAVVAYIREHGLYV